jgi:membrane-bound lytic murein transglycosylase B
VRLANLVLSLLATTAGVTGVPAVAATPQIPVPPETQAAKPAQEEPTRPSFAEWLDGVRQEALARGIRQEIVDQALSDIAEPMPVILERDRAQAETVFSLEKYIQRRLTPKLVKAGRDAFASHREVLGRIEQKYGVPPTVVTAIWGIESNYGVFPGVRPIIAALATLAWDPRRSALFRRELFDALEILNRGDIEFSHLRGSWAGAMGQVQFMPSSYLQFAEDYDGDGRKDIWATPGDVFASIANYLKGHGWKAGESWGRAVKVAPEVARRITNEVDRRNVGCRATRDMTVVLPVKRWQELGVRLPNGKALPASTPAAALVSGTTQHYLVYSNYDALLEYNCAHSYAITVGVLADRIGSTAPIPPAAKPKPVRKKR